MDFGQVSSRDINSEVGPAVNAVFSYCLMGVTDQESLVVRDHLEVFGDGLRDLTDEGVAVAERPTGLGFNRKHVIDDPTPRLANANECEFHRLDDRIEVVVFVGDQVVDLFLTDSLLLGDFLLGVDSLILDFVDPRGLRNVRKQDGCSELG